MLMGGQSCLEEGIRVCICKSVEEREAKKIWKMHAGYLRREDALSRSKWILGVNHIAASLR